MNKRSAILSFLIALACCWTACNDDVESAGQSVLGQQDAIVVLVDTFPLTSAVDSCEAIISQADSFLLGEIETDYGLLRASILTQLACPEGFSYPANASIDSICLFMYYSSWVGDAYSPLAIDAYLMDPDKETFRYSGTYPTDLNIDDYCSRERAVLANHRIVVASEKLDSIQDANGIYIPMMRMRLNDDFKDYFWQMQSFSDQDTFNKAFHGLLIESSFGSSTMLNISDIALGVYYSFSYTKIEGRPDTVVHAMKAFYANSEVRTVNHLAYQDKANLLETLQKDSDTYNYIIAPACAYTHMVFPMARITDSIMEHMIDSLDGDTVKRPYVNKAEVRVEVENVYAGSETSKTRNDWLQPADYMLLIKEESVSRFFAKRELPSDTCALLSPLNQGVDSVGNAIYYYTYDMSDFLTNQLHKHNTVDELRMILMPVSVSTSSTTTSQYSSVRQQQTLSATKIKSAKSGMKFEIVYCGFSIPNIEK